MALSQLKPRSTGISVPDSLSSAGCSLIDDILHNFCGDSAVRIRDLAPSAQSGHLSAIVMSY